MAKDSRGKQTKGDIIRSAIHLFSLHGYFHTSTNDILQATSVSKGAFYHHFKSKEDLALAVLDQVVEDYQQMIGEPVMAVEDPGQRPMFMLNRIVELNETGQWSNCLLLARFAQEMTQHEGKLPEQVSSIINWMIGFWQQLIADAQAAGTVSRALQPRTLAELVTGALFGAVGFRELEGKPFNLTKIADHVKMMIAAG